MLSRSGKIFGTPYAERSVLVIDPVAKQIVEAVGMIVPNNGCTWARGLLELDGRIFDIPFSASSVLIVHPAAI